MIIRAPSSAQTDATVAIVLACLYIWALYAADEAAVDAARRYGRNIDSGAALIFVGETYLAPLALLFALSAFLQCRNWRLGKVMHWLAIAGALVPVPVVVSALLDTAACAAG